MNFSKLLCTLILSMFSGSLCSMYRHMRFGTSQAQEYVDYVTHYFIDGLDKQLPQLYAQVSALVESDDRLRILRANATIFPDDNQCRRQLWRHASCLYKMFFYALFWLLMPSKDDIDRFLVPFSIDDYDLVRRTILRKLLDFACDREPRVAF